MPALVQRKVEAYPGGMEILVLGGTRFVGRAIVDAALTRGHGVTVFNRGNHPEAVPAGVRTITGDRTGDLAGLRSGRWDAAIDAAGYLPRHVRASAELLAERCEHYTFVSTISVYADYARTGMDEGAPVQEPPDPEPEELEMEAYGALKVGCERAAEAAMPGRLLTVRPGLIVGPHDYVERFPYWVRTVAAGGEVLAPGDPERQVQWIDARDLAGWIVRLAEQHRTGTFNATGPAAPATMRDLLEGIRDGVGGDARFTWVSAEFLEREGVGPWEEMPFWAPPAIAGLLAVDVARAVETGLVFRPVSVSAADTLEWLRGGRPEPDIASGISPERQRELLSAWHAEVAA